MPLTCELGWHRANPLARWNDGYYFSKCTRCGRDLVRTAYQRWHIPKGFRVVWQASPPEPRPRISVTSIEGAAAPAPAPAELPIQEVLRHLGERDLTNDGGVGCEDEPSYPIPSLPPQEVHLGSVRVTEVRVDQLLVNEMQLELPPTEISGEDSADPELPFEELQAPMSPGQAEAPPSGEEPRTEQAEAPSHVPQEPIQRAALDDFMADSSDLDFWDTAPRAEKAEHISPTNTHTDTLEGGPLGEDLEYGTYANDVPAFKTLAEEVDVEDTPDFQELDGDSCEIAEHNVEAEPELHVRDARTARPSFLKAFRKANPPEETDEQGEIPQTGRRFALSGQIAVASLAAAAVLMLASLVQRGTSEPAAVPPASEPSPEAPSLAIPAAGASAAPPALAAPATQAAGPAVFPSRQKAFVTANILNCRASPVAQAGSVKKLSRGAEVEVLAREAEWMSISHNGRQCWAAVRYISPDRPA